MDGMNWLNTGMGRGAIFLDQTFDRYNAVIDGCWRRERL